MLNDIVLLIVGGIGGIVGKRAVGAVTQAINPPSAPPSAPPSSPASVPVATVATVAAVPSNAMPVWVNPPLDETWTPPPPPTTPPTHLESDAVREEIALARREGQYA